MATNIVKFFSYAERHYFDLATEMLGELSQTELSQAHGFCQKMANHSMLSYEGNKVKLVAAAVTFIFSSLTNYFTSAPKEGKDKRPLPVMLVNGLTTPVQVLSFIGFLSYGMGCAFYAMEYREFIQLTEAIAALKG